MASDFPQGPSGLNDGIYGIASTATSAQGAIIPLTLYASTAPTVMTIAENAVNVPEGTYLVSYSLNASSTTATTIGVGLYLNGALITTENITESVTADETVALSKTAIVTVTAPSTISIYNTSNADVTIVNAGLSVVKLQ